MTISLTRLLTPAEFTAMNDDAISRGYYREDTRIFTPGMGWYEPWYWDPVKAAELGVATYAEYRTKYPEKREFYGGLLLSEYYWKTWSKIRPPICVVLPDGEMWEIDRKSSNGNGWTVNGTWPNLSCTPSIAAKGYHGYLGSQGASPGQFTKNLDNKAAPNGVYPYKRTWSRRTPVDPSDPRRVKIETFDGDPPPDFREVEPEGGWHYVG